jgi:hypothetical protein
MLRDVELKDLVDVFRDESCANALIQVFSPPVECPKGLAQTVDSSLVEKVPPC